MVNARLLSLLCLALAVRPLAAHDYYVALNGNDANPGTLEQPFATFRHARRFLGAGDTLYARQGVYREIIYVTAGGTATAPIIYRPYGHETVVLTGADPVAGAWRPWQGKIWCLDHAPPAGDLYLDGRELSEARWPAVPFGAPMDAGWAVAAKGTTMTTLCDPKLPALDLAGAGVHITPGLAWVSYTRTVKSAAKGALAFQTPITGSPAYTPRPGNRYFLYGSLALLRAPGQWYQDSSTGRLYLWTPDGLAPTAHDVEIARRKVLIYDNGFSHVEFRGFYTFSGGVKIGHCQGCRVLGLNQRYVQHYTSVQGYSAEPPTNGIYLGVGCEWADGSVSGSSGDGLAVSGSGDRIHHMVISDVCEAGGYAAAIALLGSGHVVEDNTCHDSGRTLIDLGDCRGGSVSRNELYRAGLLTKDVGAIYSYRTDGGGMVISYNDIHDVAAVRGIGIYLDNGDANYVVHHNLVHGCAWAALELNLPSLNNRVYNNTLWGCRHWVWADGAPHSMTGTVLENNLYSGDQLLVKGKLAPACRDNAGALQPPPLFVPGGFQLDPRSLAVGRGMAAPPYTDGWKGEGPDLGAFACGVPAWNAGCSSASDAFPYPDAEAYADGSRHPRRGFWHWW